MVQIHAVSAILFLALIASSKPITVDAELPDAKASFSSSNHKPSNIFRGDPFDTDWDDFDTVTKRNKSAKTPQFGSSRRGSSFFGFGREFSFFESAPCRVYQSSNNDDGEDRFGGYAYDDSDADGYDLSNHEDDDRNDEDDDDDFFSRMERYRQRRKSISSISSGGFNDNEGYSFSRGGRPPFNPWQDKQQRRRREQRQHQKPRIIQGVQDWWMERVDPKLQSLPKIVCRIEPNTTLKLRKTFRPLKTIVRLGADYNTQQGIWQFKSSWEDSIIGGKITLSGNKELQLTKSWQMSVGGVEDLVTRLRLRATINLQTFQAYAKVGFRTERLTPIDVIEGFTILKRLPLDGSGGNLKLEVKANVALPEPEIEYRTESQARSLTGMGNVEVSIDEMNLLLDY
ncbi:unnamed protein product [Pseudo-nitzschia multistriata]|uniref:Lipid/polyisoprenoid-binding YceI-like domain-containing protein n=1 Tax=Pseudo-nitzschia multistriata TaxID=183589 RepID=A0A448YW21_9STRA|nr:unnamed protein product [Pseudo-nitzschia multistriata]